MGGLCAEEKTYSRDPSWLQIARAACTMRILILSSRSQHRRFPAPRVDKPVPVPYSVATSGSEPPLMTLRTLLDRYIFTELLYPFSVSLGMLCFIMLTRELFGWSSFSSPRA